VKAKKALKKLALVEEVLADVADNYSKIDQSARNLLVSATITVGQAKQRLTVQEALKAAQKKTANAEDAAPVPVRSRRTAKPAAKAPAASRRKPVRAVAGQLLSKTS
jgi:hypothetical protein